MSGKFSRHCRPLLASPQLRHFANPHRGYAMVITRILRGALKIRYLLLGGAVGGGVTLQKKYEQWKEGLPDLEWLENLMPSEKQWQDFRESLMSIKNVADKIEIGKQNKSIAVCNYENVRQSEMG